MAFSKRERLTLKKENEGRNPFEGILHWPI